MRKTCFLAAIILACAGCSNLEKKQTGSNTPVAVYFNYGDTGLQSAGVRMIPVKTPVGEFNVWTNGLGIIHPSKFYCYMAVQRVLMNIWSVLKVSSQKRGSNSMSMIS